MFFADFFEQAFEIIFIEKCSVLHALAVEDVSLDREVPQNASSPLAELGGTDRVDAIANGNDGVEIVVLDFPGHLPRTFGLNCSEFPKSCLLADFTLLEDVLQVFVDGRNSDLKEPGHQLLGEPDGLLLVAHFQPVPAGLG